MPPFTGTIIQIHTHIKLPQISLSSSLAMAGIVMSEIQHKLVLSVKGLPPDSYTQVDDRGLGRPLRYGRGFPTNAGPDSLLAKWSIRDYSL